MTTQTATTMVNSLTVDPQDGEDHSECLLGNEAIVRGALESGVAFACGYPGTPSSEVTDAFAKIAPSCGITFEYSVNEKVCLEMAFAASLAGARSICAMKHLGLMVAGDPISTIPYVGVVGGMVVVSAGDPSCRTSPNEQDQRHLGPMLHMPILDPSTPSEAHAMARFAFELSEGAQLPVILRVTTRVCHTRAPVTFGPLRPPKVTGFSRDPSRYTPIPVHARRMRIELKERMARARKMIGLSGFFQQSGRGKTVILATGAPAATCADVLAEHGLEDQVALWKLGTPHPLPEDELVAALQGIERLLVLEELSPFLEDAVRSLCARHDLCVQVLGKRTGHLPEEFEYGPSVIEQGLKAALSLGPGAEQPRHQIEAVARPPSLCPGCPHRAAYFAARVAFDEDQLYFNDIGCYSLGYGPPLNTVDALLCMGAGFTLAAGVSRVTGKRTVGFLGDSTFFHSGMPALLNAIKERVNMVAVILDNQVTAMTGFQESPSTPSDHTASIEAVVRGLGARQIETVDPYDLSATIAALRRARDATGLSVIIVKRPCPVHQARIGQSPYGVRPYQVNTDGCRACGRAAAGLRCNQPLSEAYERQLAHARAQQPRGTTDAPPVVAPCARRCPLSLCIQGYAGNIAAGDYAAALGQILARTPLPESVCRVCHRPCEQACIRRDLDESVAINDLKRFVVDWASREHISPKQPECEPAHGHTVAVIGAGPSGLAAAHDLALRGYGVTLFEAKDRAGGLLAYGIPAYRLPTDVLDRDLGRVFDLGVTLEAGQRLGCDFSLDDLFARGFERVYLAIGAGQGRLLDLEAEEGSPQLVRALDYLQAVREGHDTPCARQVVVLGGGNAAVDAARTARRLGGTAVTIACLEARDQMPALTDEISAAELEGVVIRTGLAPQRLQKQGIAVAPVRQVAGGGNDNPEERLAADLVILAIGQTPDLDFLDQGDLSLERTNQGCLKVDPETCQSSDPRVFAGGDAVVAIAHNGRTVTDAIAWGQRAAWGIDQSLRGAEAADSRPPPSRLASLQVLESAPPGKRPKMPRMRPLERPLAVRTQALGGFEEVTHSLTEAQAKLEASRCLACGWCGNCRACIDLFGCPAFREQDGKAFIDGALCNGCGVCADLCPNGAIRPREQA